MKQIVNQYIYSLLKYGMCKYVVNVCCQKKSIIFANINTLAIQKNFSHFLKLNNQYAKKKFFKVKKIRKL